MDRFRKDDPDAPRLAAAVLWDEVGPAYTMETFIRGAAAVLDHIEPDAIEQPRLPTRSEVEAKARAKGFNATQAIAGLMIEIGGATEDPEPEVDPAQVEALAKLLHAERERLVSAEEPPWVDLDSESRCSYMLTAEWLLASGRVQVTPQ